MLPPDYLINNSPAMLQMLSAGLSKTLGSVERLTGTFATNSEERFHNLLNMGYNKTVTGMFSYSKAIADTVDDLARNGVSVSLNGVPAFRYASGRAIAIESAVRMNVLTGVNQTAAQITKEGMQELGVSLVRTTAHLGARNKGEGFKNHESWQGKVFYWRELDNKKLSKTPHPEKFGLQIASEGGIMNRGGERMNVLPRADEAVISDTKISGYALDPIKSRGKSVAFERALGYNLSNAQLLSDNIRNNLAKFPAEHKGNKGYGDTYSVLMELTGPNGKTANVMTAWLDDTKTGEMRMTSAYVKKRKEGS